MSRPAQARPLHPAYTRLTRLAALRGRLAALFGRAPAAPRTARLGVEGLEDRVVLDGRPLPQPIIFAGAGPGQAPMVEAYDAETGALMFAVPAYGPGFVGGVRVAAGDFTADGYPDVVVAPGPGRAPSSASSTARRASRSPARSGRSPRSGRPPGGSPWPRPTWTGRAAGHRGGGRGHGRDGGQGVQRADRGAGR